MMRQRRSGILQRGNNSVRLPQEGQPTSQQQPHAQLRSSESQYSQYASSSLRNSLIANPPFNAAPVYNYTSLEHQSKVASRTLCSDFTNTGICYRLPNCFKIHDRKKVALCPSILQKARCSMKSQCTMSHDWSFHNAPDCFYFVQGCCTRPPPCPFAHHDLHHPWSQTCPQFAELGYCEAGPDCEMLHIPDTNDDNKSSTNAEDTLEQIDVNDSIEKGSDEKQIKAIAEDSTTSPNSLRYFMTSNNVELEMKRGHLVGQQQIEVIIPNSKPNDELERQLDFIPF